MSEIDKVFFDSNVLVYFVDNREPNKQFIADKLIKKAIMEENGMISTQSLQEFYNVTTKKLLCSPEKAKEYAQVFMESFEVTQVTPEMIFSAIDISVDNRLSFWDSLIISAAQDSGCALVYSEDLNHGQLVEGVKVMNPFAA